MIIIKSFDVIIIGGGPAGIAAAQVLNEHNIKYLLIDKCEFPREKLCGGGLTNKSVKILNDLNIKLDSINTKPVNDILLVAKNIKRKMILDNPIIMVDRKEFDNSNVNKIVKNFSIENIISIDNNTLTTDKDNYSFKYIIFADGINGYSRKLIKGRKFGFCLELDVEEKYDNTVLDFNAIPTGYGWIFPKVKSTTIGLGDFSDKKCDYLKLLNDFCSNYGFIVDKTKIKGYHIPIFSESVYNESVIDNKYILVGDAASLVNPVSGEGIYYALVSGKNAALSIIECINNKDNLKEVYFKKNEGIIHSLKKMSIANKHLYSKKKNLLIKIGLNNKKIVQKLNRVFG